MDPVGQKLEPALKLWPEQKIISNVLRVVAKI
jgi:hypothetical protein